MIKIMPILLVSGALVAGEQVVVDGPADLVDGSKVVAH